MRGKIASDGATIVAAADRRIRALILTWLARDGEMPTSWIVSSVQGLGSVARKRPEVVAALESLESSGQVVRERRVRPHAHGSRVMREVDFWRLADGRTQA